MEPERFGPYTLMRRLAVGGMGELYLAQRTGHASYSSLVVVKRIRADLIDEEGFVDMFLNEAKVAQLLDHPNVVRIYEWGEVEGTYFMAMEYVSGKDVGTLLKRRGSPLDLATALYVMVAICEGLGFAHNARGPDGRPLRIVHRDINPQNILASYAGAVKITDFGIAKVQAEQRNKTRAGVLKGKFGYLSPEQARGIELDERSDIFALGLLLFEITIGRRANPGRNDSEMLFAAADGRLLYPSQITPNYPAQLEEIYARATALKPEERYQTARQLQDALLAFQLENRIMATASTLAEVMQTTFAQDWNDERRALTPVVDAHSLQAEPRPTAGPAPGAIEDLEPSETDPFGKTCSKEFLLQGAEPRRTPAPTPRGGTGAGRGDDGRRQAGSRAMSVTQIGRSGTAALQAAPSEAGMVVDLPRAGEDEPTLPGGPELLAQLTGGAAAPLEAKPTTAAKPIRRDRQNAIAPADASRTARTRPAPAPVRRRPGRRWLIVLISCMVSLGVGVGLFAYLWGGRHAVTHGRTGRGKGHGGGGAQQAERRRDAGPTPADVRPWARREARPAAPDRGAPSPDHGAVTRAPKRPSHTPIPAPRSPAAPGQLRITSTPSLTVFWRGRRLGNTPLTATFPAGRQTLVLRSAELKIDLTRRAAVSAGHLGNLQVQVGRGKLDLRIRPWAHVEIEGRRRGTTPIQPIDLYEGQYTVRLLNPEFGAPFQTRVTIRPNETTKLIHVFSK